MPDITSGAVGAVAEGVADGAEGDDEDSVEDGTGDGGDGTAVAVTGALGVAVAETRGDGLAAGRELAVRDGETPDVAGCVQAGIPVCCSGVTGGALVPWPLEPPGVAMTDGARTG